MACPATGNRIHELDARGLLCPLPVIRVQDTVVRLSAGERLEVYCTDPGALNDIPAWCRINGHQVLDCQDRGADIVIRIQVGPEGGD
jgi:tRNA 2-thiouridine synthesizing protein A